MSDYKDFLLYGSLESSDSDDSDYSPSGDSQESREDTNFGINFKIISQL